MPELAEIETVRRRLEAALEGKCITEVIADASDHFFFKETPLADLRKALTRLGWSEGLERRKKDPSR